MESAVLKQLISIEGEFTENESTNEPDQLSNKAYIDWQANINRRKSPTEKEKWMPCLQIFEMSSAQM